MKFALRKSPLKIKIGLELHVTLKTRTKLFSGVAQTLFASPNTNTTLIDWGYPGVLPQVNLQVVKKVYQLGHLLHCQLAELVSFDRKHYYYFDLPKGYQITQFFQPLARNGFLQLFLADGTWKTVPIWSAHIEEDTAKISHRNGLLLIDYNRAGNPLVEITTAPVFTNYSEIKTFVTQIIRLLRQQQISDAQFANGSIRIDLNVSTCHDPQEKIWHHRNEIKNLNTLLNLKKALQQEITAQKQAWTTRQPMLNESWTKTFNEQHQKLVRLRHKFSYYDYMFIPENNIIPIRLQPELCRTWLANLPDPDAEEKLIHQYKLTPSQAIMVFRYQLTSWCETLHQAHLPNSLIFAFFQQVLIPLNKQHATFLKSASAINLAVDLLQYRQQKGLDWPTLQQVFATEIQQPTGKWQVNLQRKATTTIYLDAPATMHLLRTIIQQHPHIKKRYQDNSTATTNFLFGQMQKTSSQKLDPQLVLRCIKASFASDS